MLGTIQVDLDGLWTYYRYLAWKPPHSYTELVYEEGLLLFLELFKNFNIKATFFIVGKDAEKPQLGKIIQKIIDEGHEIASHSYSHPENFTKLSPQELEQEISLSENILNEICKEPIVGFKAPTFDVNEQCLAILSKRGYRYDSSLIPSYLNPIFLRIMHSFLRKRFLNLKCGRFEFGFSPLSIYRPQLECIFRKGEASILEVPISVLPYLRLPMHSSYIFNLGLGYFELGLELWQRSKLPLCYLFHGIDLVNTQRAGVPLPFFSNLKKRKNICGYIIKRLKSSAELFTTKKLAERVKT